MTLVDGIYAMTLLVLFSLFFFILKGLK